MEDIRAKYCEYTSQQYPYIVEYEYSMDFKGLMYLPSWSPRRGENLALAYGRFEVISDVPNLRYKMTGGAPEPTVSSEGSSAHYLWELNDLPALEREPYSPGYMNPKVLLAPSYFEMDKYKGDATTWKSFGQFIYRLNEGRDDLPDELKNKVHELTDHLTDPADKIAVLYRYMQENTRYVSIQLGIGGWQTFPASYVYEHGYGDCKALTNYLQSMLKEIDIISYATLIHNNDEGRDINYTFPSNQFKPRSFVCTRRF